MLQSRIKGVTKKMLYELLYEERSLIDYFDKNLAIFPVEDWCYFERKRNLSKTFQEELEQAIRRFAKFNECQKEIVMG